MTFCVHVCLCTACVSDAQKRVPDTLELELQVVVAAGNWTQVPRSPEKEANTLKHWSISSVPLNYFLNFSDPIFAFNPTHNSRRLSSFLCILISSPCVNFQIACCELIAVASGWPFLQIAPSIVLTIAFSVFFQLTFFLYNFKNCFFYLAEFLW